MKNLKELTGVKVLSKNEQKSIIGGYACVEPGYWCPEGTYCCHRGADYHICKVEGYPC